ncbi:MAG: threonine ammonia-lyase [Gemmatimonas sp.]|nr:threonine ammonia-lyase [Gemmatimonas sp.]
MGRSLRTVRRPLINRASLRGNRCLLRVRASSSLLAAYECAPQSRLVARLDLHDFSSAAAESQFLSSAFRRGEGGGRALRADRWQVIKTGAAEQSIRSRPGDKRLELRQIEEAYRRVVDEVIQTPCTPSEVFGELFGGRAWFKFENLQRTGSFKERGALNRILAIPEQDRSRGVVAASAGNHAQGVAYHASRLGVNATIVMPERSPLIKVTNTESLGATVVLHGSSYDEAIEEALRIQGEHGATLIHAFDDEHVIAGQGTIGLELIEQCPEMEVLVVPVGGGGLIGGIAAAVKAIRPEVRIVGVEAEVLPAASKARDSGGPVTIPAGETIADGIAVRRIGAHTFPLIERFVDDLVTVKEEEIASAVLLLLEREKTVAEPAAAVTLAAVVGDRTGRVAGHNVVMLLSGGNIDVNLLSRIIDRGLINDGRLTFLEVRVQDRPGALAALTARIAEKGANILRLDHRRGTEGLWLTEVEVELLLETRGRTHVDELVSFLTAEGYTIHRG